jgi:hypothetical protein
VDYSELERLSSKEYSKETFGLNYPFCARIDANILREESKRFWKGEFKVNNQQYKVCSQWVITRKTKFLDFLLRINIIDKIKYEELNEQVDYIATNKIVRGIPRERVQVVHQNKLEAESLEMSKHYNKFYYLERSIRILIEEVMQKAYGENWWESIDSRVKRNVERNLEYELDTSHTKRSERAIDYTTFGDLRKIINNHWEVFSVKFRRNLNSVNEVLIDLNRLRVPIAHCSPLVKKEVNRLEIRLDDWNALLIKTEEKEEIVIEEIRVIQNTNVETSALNTKNSFIVVLGKKYYEDGFFNVRVSYSEQFGGDLSKIKIQLGDNPNNYTIGKINRTANSNATPRIFAGPLYKKWIQLHFIRGDVFRVDVIEKDFIKLSQVKNQ